MVEDAGEKEDKFDFTAEGEDQGYISLEQARLQAMEHARDNTEFYGSAYEGVRFVWEILSAEDGEDFYDIKLSFRPSGRFRGEPGIEQLIFDKTGALRMRQMLDEPTGMDDPASEYSTTVADPPDTPLDQSTTTTLPPAPATTPSPSPTTPDRADQPAPLPQTAAAPPRGDLGLPSPKQRRPILPMVFAGIVVVMIAVIGGVVFNVRQESSAPLIIEVEVTKEVVREVEVVQEVLKEVDVIQEAVREVEVEPVVVEKEVIKEVIKEVPVEVVVEVVKEVPVEVVVEKEVIKEVPVAVGTVVGAEPSGFRSTSDAASALAGGPGAIYVDQLDHLAGPAPAPDLGDVDGNVPLDSLQRHTYIYESDYYRKLLDKARFADPTPLVSQGEKIRIQHACINRLLLTCKLIESFFAPNLRKRTNGQVELVITSFSELGLAGPDTLDLVEDGTLAMAHVYGGYLVGIIPALEIQNLWGVFPDSESAFAAAVLVSPDLEKMVIDQTDGVVLNHNWFAGNNQYLFTNKDLLSPADFQGVKTRSHSASLSDWIEGMGAEAQFVAFAEVYDALERGIIDAGVTGADAANSQRWFEVTDFIIGPLINFPSTNNVINAGVWDKIPADLQLIPLEEGAKSELEALRLASIQNETGLRESIDAGLQFVEFSPAIQVRSDEAVVTHVIPGWVKQLGGPDKPAVKLFNEKVGPLVGLRINTDGSVDRK